MLRRRTDIGIYLSPTAILVCQTTSSWFNKKKKDVTFPLVFVYFKEDITKGYSYAATYQEDGTLLTLEDSCQVQINSSLMECITDSQCKACIIHT